MGAESANPVGKSAAEGGYCRLVQRRLSALVSPALARRFGPNAVTALDLLAGVAAAVCVLFGQLVAGALLVQIFGVLSCADGEVARIRGETSAAGDFYDTMTDRVVEVALVAAVTARLQSETGTGALWAGFAVLAGVLCLVVSSEKFRSAFRVSYPKGRWERPFSWISAGSDARLLVLTVALVGWAVGGPAVALVVLWALAGGIGLNLVWRSVVLVRTALPAASTGGLS
ncbi:CDP-alcohol phosphatidyltransferase family protein [Umezawaea endophytica]|uniref:CDP-alcohol phosphatidyltransferase family protein n=1 Tax=Umezawaea endophytica TaxID=1654476 RepID=A0A9X2VJS5_9PSEU|nr:CDP-alcohol phosphatidyltransferase family protein [Umezawaea endophytica]MCS7477821.1 CDP-alcohol phosphatidyltransferase family protein [Umezawaea endophytica]